MAKQTPMKDAIQDLREHMKAQREAVMKRREFYAGHYRQAVPAEAERERLKAMLESTPAMAMPRARGGIYEFEGNRHADASGAGCANAETETPDSRA